MLSIAIKNTVVGTVLACFCIATASAAIFIGKKPPRYILDPLIGLRVAANAKLDALPKALVALCNRDPADTTSKAHLWIFARASDTRATYYLLSGYSEVRKSPSDAPLYDVMERGGMYVVANGKCVADPADEYYQAPTEEVPLPVLHDLARDLAARLVRAAGGTDRLRTELINQRIDFDTLPPVVQEAFRPYFPQ